MVDNPIAAIVIGAMCGFLLVFWTIPSARQRRPHMVFVSFALIAFLTLAVLTIASVWQPTSHTWLRVVGWIVQLLGVVLLTNSFHYLSTRGRPLDKGEPTSVVDTGVYRLTRHPMYAGMGIWAVGMALCRPNMGSSLIAGACVVFTLLAAVKEDDYNLKRFGESYAEYMRRVPLLNLFQKRARS